MENFTYYDTLSNIIPGTIFLWGIFFFGPSGDPTGLSVIFTGNQIVDPILFLIIAYFVGHILQFLSKFIIEPIVKKIFWKGHFFSEIFLVQCYNYAGDSLFGKILLYAENDLKINSEELSVLKDSNQKDAAYKLSNFIYRQTDAKSYDSSKGQKAHLQNVFYSFFRNITMCFFLIFVLDVIFLIVGSMSLNTRNIFSLLVSGSITLIFLNQTKTRGELYIKGLFWSFV
jgi:hypothetical protein